MSIKSICRFVVAPVFSLALSAVLLAACTSPPHNAVGAYTANSKVDCLPKVTLTDQNGHPVTLSALKGKPALIDFIYTNCPGPCLTLTSKMVGVAEDLGPEMGSKVRIISITVDPTRDTPQAMDKFAKKLDANRKGWLFLTGTHQEVNDALAPFKMHLVKAGPNGILPHTLTVFLLGPNGRQKWIYNSGTVKTEVMAHDAEQLAARG